MTAHFLLTLDTSPPASPTLMLNAGADRTGHDVVTATVASASEDVREMRIWGDLDPDADGRYQATEQASPWVLFTPEVVLKLAPGTGRKTVYARLRDDVHNATVVFSDFIDLDTDTPVVTISQPVDRARISLQAGFSEAIFGWQANTDFVAYQVRVVPTIGSTHLAGVPLTGERSVNTAGQGAFPANTSILTLVDAADLQAVSPGDTPKVVKVFIQDAKGRWSA